MFDRRLLEIIQSSNVFQIRVCSQKKVDTYFLQFLSYRFTATLLTLSNICFVVDETLRNPGGVSITKAHQAVPDLKNIVPKVPE